MDEWWVPVISAAAALGGVLLADVRQRGREREGRFTELRQQAFVDIYAWSLRANDAMDDHLFGRPARAPILSAELQAKLFIYLDAEIALKARRAATKLEELTTNVKGRGAKTDLDVAFAIGQIQAAVAISTKDLDTSTTTRFRWYLGRIVHPPLSTEDPPWDQLSVFERVRRRLREVRPGRKPRGPLEEEGVGPGLD